MLAMFFFESIYSDSGENFLGVFDSKEIGINSYLSYKNTVYRDNNIVYSVSRSCSGMYTMETLKTRGTLVLKV